MNRGELAVQNWTYRIAPCPNDDSNATAWDDGGSSEGDILCLHRWNLRWSWSSHEGKRLQLKLERSSLFIYMPRIHFDKMHNINEHHPLSMMFLSSMHPLPTVEYQQERAFHIWIELMRVVFVHRYVIIHISRTDVCGRDQDSKHQTISMFTSIEWVPLAHLRLTISPTTRDSALIVWLFPFLTTEHEGATIDWKAFENWLWSIDYVFHSSTVPSSSSYPDSNWYYSSQWERRQWRERLPIREDDGKHRKWIILN